MKSQFIACEVNQHVKCSHEFYYKNTPFTCECACHKINIHSAPLGLSEYQCSDGQVFYDKQSAIAHQQGLEVAR